MRAIYGVLATLLAAGCAPAVQYGAAPALIGTLEVEVAADSARLTLHATNPSAAPVVLEYATAQRFDFELRTLAGATVWRWAAERSFAQVLGEEQVGPGETLRYRVSVPLPPPGDYVAVGRSSAVNERLELSTSFQVPAR